MQLSQFLRLTCAISALGLTSPLWAQDSAPAPADPPELIVAISVDQLSSDLFEQYRAHYTGGLARLAGGAAFPSGYQAHAATETCPGHSTILTGTHPTRNGIIANGWMRRNADGTLVDVYCAEDEANKPERGYTPSAVTLLVPTLGERMKATWPQSRNVAVSGKDRGALMMGGKNVDAIYWREGAGFGTLAGREPGADAKAVSARVQQVLASGAPAYPVPKWCEARDRAIALPGQTVGSGRFKLEAGDGAGLVRSPRFDEATLELAGRLVESEKLGADAVPDVLSISLSATDYIGHAYGTNGLETCIQIAELDAMLGKFFAMLDAKGIDYVALLTADHGGVDLPERASQQAADHARRVDMALVPQMLGKAIGAELGIAGDVLAGTSPAGDIWLAPGLSRADTARVTRAFKAHAGRSADVAAVFTAAEIAAAPLPSGDPRAWSLLDRARASFYPGRSGDLVMLLAPGVSPIPVPREGIVATHGSPWDYDRRVPILFWRQGMAQFEQPLPVKTVDIAPTLAALVKLPVEEGAFDGDCLDLDSGVADTCGR